MPNDFTKEVLKNLGMPTPEPDIAGAYAASNPTKPGLGAAYMDPQSAWQALNLPAEHIKAILGQPAGSMPSQWDINAGASGFNLARQTLGAAFGPEEGQVAGISRTKLLQSPAIQRIIRDKWNQANKEGPLSYKDRAKFFQDTAQYINDNYGGSLDPGEKPVNPQQLYTKISVPGSKGTYMGTRDIAKTTKQLDQSFDTSSGAKIDPVVGYPYGKDTTISSSGAGGGGGPFEYQGKGGISEFDLMHWLIENSPPQDAQQVIDYMHKSGIPFNARSSGAGGGAPTNYIDFESPYGPPRTLNIPGQPPYTEPKPSVRVPTDQHIGNPRGSEIGNMADTGTVFSGQGQRSTERLINNAAVSPVRQSTMLNAAGEPLSKWGNLKEWLKWRTSTAPGSENWLVSPDKAPAFQMTPRDIRSGVPSKPYDPYSDPRQGDLFQPDPNAVIKNLLAGGGGA